MIACTDHGLEALFATLPWWALILVILALLAVVVFVEDRWGRK